MTAPPNTRLALHPELVLALSAIAEPFTVD